MILNRIIKGIKHRVSYCLHRNRYREIHLSCFISEPLIVTPQFISLCENVIIYKHARIQGVSKYNNQFFSPSIIIKKGVTIQQNLHLTCAKKVEIGENTAIAANVTITDIHHPYTDVNLPIEKQDIEVHEVIIGDDCKVYNNVVILPGVHIGKHVTIGANSVVTKDIPDFTVAVGNPARVIRKYDFEKKEWLRI